VAIVGRVAVTTRPRSILHGTDQDCLRQLLELHAPAQPRILDATFGRGSMWRGLEYQPWRNDSNPELEADSHYDFRELPEEWTGTFDVVVFDPPHIAEAGARSRYASHFGARNDDLQHAPDICHLFAPFLLEAARVLKRRGTILCKVIDQVHRGRYRHQYVDYILAVRATPGLVACEPLIKEERRAETMTGHNWQVVHHSRRAHAYWAVAKKGARC
jgi:hypothetical protein